MNEDKIITLPDVILSDYPDVLNIQHIREILGIGQSTAYKLINSGEIRSIKIGRQIRILKTDLIKYLNT